MRRHLRKISWSALTICSIALVAGAFFHWLSLEMVEVFGFITGAVCVLLVVEQNIWNFPIGLANNIVFIALFYSSKLYGDMALQFVYIALGLMGWWEWLYGGKGRSRLAVSHTRATEAIVLGVISCAATAALTTYFSKIGDSAPFLDALTTVLSLAAQYLLNMKRIENWWIWITADVIYVFMYCLKGLQLTGILYAIFILMCIAGYRSWRSSMKAEVLDDDSEEANVIEEKAS